MVRWAGLNSTTYAGQPGNEVDVRRVDVATGFLLGLGPFALVVELVGTDNPAAHDTITHAQVRPVAVKAATIAAAIQNFPLTAFSLSVLAPIFVRIR